MSKHTDGIQPTKDSMDAAPKIRDLDLSAKVAAPRLAGWSRLWMLIFWLSVAATMGLVVVTSPFSGGPAVVMVYLLLFWCTTYALVMLLRPFAGGLGIARLNHYYWLVATTLSFSATFIFALHTLRQLRLTDIVLIVLFDTVLFFYLRRRAGLQK